MHDCKARRSHLAQLVLIGRPIRSSEQMQELSSLEKAMSQADFLLSVCLCGSHCAGHFCVHITVEYCSDHIVIEGYK